MFSRQALWSIAASTAILAAATFGSAQPAKTPTTGSVQIIPVSYKNDQVAATVNGDNILVGELRKVLDTRPYPLTLTQAQKKEMQKAALDVLIEDLLLRQFLAKNAPPVTQAEFNKAWQEVLDGLRKQKKTLDEFCKESGMDESIVRRDLIAQLQWKVMLTRYLPDAEAKKYYDANKPFFDKVFVRASHILIRLPPKASVEQQNKAVQQMQVWRQEIVSGKARFEDIAKKHSDCPSKDARDRDNKPLPPGDIGQFPYKFVVVPEFAKTAYSMRVGDISEPVVTVFGVHLIKVTDRTKGEPSTFEAVKDTVREVWAKDQEVSVRVMADLREKANIKIHLQ